MVEDTRANGCSRRTVLKRGLAGVAGALALSGTASATHDLRDDYRTVVDVVDAGADPTGEESITSVLEGLRGDDTLLEFPEGRYFMDRHLRFTGFENVGLRGRGDATLVPANYRDFRDDSHKLFRLGTHYAPGRDLHVENFRVDLRAEDTGVRPFEVSVSDGLVVRDVDILGQHDSGTWGVGLFRVQDPDGKGLVERFRAPAGAARDEETPADFLSRGGPSGILCNYSHRGTITFRDCVLGPFPDNGLYASGGTGVVVVEGGTYRNSGTASIRLGGRKGRIEGTRVVVDRDPFDIPQEGIRLDNGSWFDLNGVTIDIERPNGEALNVQNPVGGAFLRNASVSMGEDAYTAVQINPETGGTYLKNVDIRIDGSESAVDIEGSDGPNVNLVDVRITGDAGGERMRHAVRCERDGCNFRRLAIDQPGGNERRGIALLGDDAFLYDCSFTCSQRGISLYGDDAWINDCYSEPYEPGRYSVKVFDGASGTRFKNNEFPAGIVRS